MVATLRPCHEDAIRLSSTTRKESVVVQEGQAAPDFELASDSGETVKLSDLRGKPVVLVFYPKDDTQSRIHSRGR